MNATLYREPCESSGVHTSSNLFFSVFLTPSWSDSDSQSLGKTTTLRAKDGKKRQAPSRWETRNAGSGDCWALLGVTRVLILLYVALHCPDVSNAIQQDQNEINRALDGSS